jgi:hypothetical protein
MRAEHGPSPVSELRSKERASKLNKSDAICKSGRGGIPLASEDALAN